MTTKEQLLNTVEYKDLGYNIVTCPVCGNYSLDSYWICDNCGWEYDGITDKNTYSEVNYSTISEYIDHILATELL